jgi:hypothetical protein
MADEVAHEQRTEHATSEMARGDGAMPGFEPEVTGVGAPPLPGLAAPIRRLVDGADPLGGTDVPADVSGLLGRRSGKGAPLPTDAANQLGDAFGRDFSAVRVHTDAQADTITRSMAATAFTHGNDLYFSQGSYDPSSSAGQHLLAHELTHVTQHQDGRHTGSGASGALTVGRADDPAEAEAEATAASVVSKLRRHATAPEPVDAGLTAGLAPLRRQAVAPIRRDLAKDWKKDSKAAGPRSKLLKVVDKAVNTFSRHVSEGAVAATLLVDLKAVLKALDDWGKVDTSQRAAAAQALQVAAQSEISRLTPKAKPKRKPKPKVDAKKPTPTPEPEPVEDTGPVITPKSVLEIVGTAATLVAEGTASLVTESTGDTGPDTGPDTTATPPIDTKGPDVTTDVKVPDTKVPDTKTPDTKTPETKGPETAPVDSKATDSTPEVKPPETADEKAARFEQEVLKGKTEVDLKVTRPELLDALMPLPDDRFAAVAAEMMLNTKGGMVDEAETRTMALAILTVQLANKTVARKLLDEMVVVVVIPRNKKMTDLVEFATLKDTKTFDGRTWNEVRGSGGFRVPGKKEVYVAVTEENTTGTDGEGDAAGTNWCYDKGYSTTSHEFAHVIDNYGLSDEDRKTVDALYKKKHDLEATTPQEWIDGWNVEIGPTTADAGTAAWETALTADPNMAGLTSLFAQIAAGGEFKKISKIAEWKPYLTAAKILSPDGKKLLGADGVELGTISPDGDQQISFHGGTPKKKTECYASVHRMEYFAQTANAYLGTNAGPDPYTIGQWQALGSPEKGKRRNGKTEAKRVEPELYKLMEKLFSKTGDLTGANPRKG